LAKEWEEGIADTGIGQLYKIRGRNGDTGWSGAKNFWDGLC
jgi:hypothetical protein